MATETDEALLLSMWNQENLGQYEGKWIAFREGVLASSESLRTISEEFLNQRRQGNAPLFAYVSFRARA